MKKMKKIVATILCLGLAISTLCACSSTGNGGEQPDAVEPTTKQTEAITETTEVTNNTEKTAESTVVETIETISGNDIIPLWNLDCEEMVRQVPPENWFTDFIDTTYIYIPLLTTDRKIGECTLFQMADYNYNASTFLIKRSPEDEGGINAEIFFLAGPDNSSGISIEINGESTVVAFMPLFYNRSKGCLAGYMRYSEGDVRFEELYWSTVLNTYMAYDDGFDPSIYGM